MVDAFTYTLGVIGPKRDAKNPDESMACFIRPPHVGHGNTPNFVGWTLLTWADDRALRFNARAPLSALIDREVVIKWPRVAADALFLRLNEGSPIVAEHVDTVKADLVEKPKRATRFRILFDYLCGYQLAVETRIKIAPNDEETEEEEEAAKFNHRLLCYNRKTQKFWLSTLPPPQKDVVRISNRRVAFLASFNESADTNSVELLAPIFRRGGYLTIANMSFRRTKKDWDVRVDLLCSAVKESEDLIIFLGAHGGMRPTGHYAMLASDGSVEVPDLLESVTKARPDLQKLVLLDVCSSNVRAEEVSGDSLLKQPKHVPSYLGYVDKAGPYYLVAASPIGKFAHFSPDSGKSFFGFTVARLLRELRDEGHSVVKTFDFLVKLTTALEAGGNPRSEAHGPMNGLPDKIYF